MTQKRLRALVIEDDGALRAGYGLVLGSLDCAMTGKRNCEEGIVELEKSRKSGEDKFDLVITDLITGGYNSGDATGVDIANKVLEDEGAVTPIYFVTGGGPDEVINAAKKLAEQYPQIEYITKPLSKQNFENMVQVARNFRIAH
ncbi:MAG: response regulator [Nanoarchaeota archaeon]|nr:response regulator [Nanoarchaeota archaeon]